MRHRYGKNRSDMDTPSTLHLWWARRPLATCRAVLFAQLVDDPSSYPDKFPTTESINKERKRLFDIIEELVVWENSTNDAVLERAFSEIRKCCNGALPPIYDPFSGGGSIPLEAQRLGLSAYGSDLNPVAVMIGKAMIEIPPKFKDQEPIHPSTRDRTYYRHVEGLAEDVKYYGTWIRQKAFERIGHLYPKVDLPREYGNGKAPVIAWIWARTVPSPDPAFGDIQVPTASSFLLSSKVNKEVWIEPLVDKVAKTITYRIRKGGTRSEIALAKLGASAGKRQAFRCIMSDAAITYDYIRKMGRSGKMGQTLIAIVAEGHHGRAYIAPSEQHERVVYASKPKQKPESLLPNNTRDFKTPNYGLCTFGDLFTDRQLVALNTFSDLVYEVRGMIECDALAAGLSDDSTPLREGGTGAKAYAEAVSVYLAFAVDKCSDYWSSVCSWHASGQKIRNTFGRQAIPMIWDYAEANPFSSSSGNWMAMCNWVWKVIEKLVPTLTGTEHQRDAQTVQFPEASVISTDPPYYDNIGYADLSDFFYCWMKPLIRPIYPKLFSVLATPKTEELVATPYRHGNKETAESFFLDGMRKAMTNMAQQSSPDYPVTIYYAFKQREITQEGISSTGWATFLQAVVEAGFAVVGTWPMRTEMASRMIASGTNALANSVVLVCCKKSTVDETISRAEFIRALRRELPSALQELQKANISPADMPQSAIGPGMGIFSRYKAVLEADDSPMSVKTGLQFINRELDEYLGVLEGDFDPDTRFTVTWFEQHGISPGDYGVANSIATARGISVESVRHAGIVESSAGKVRILNRNEIDTDWDPTADTHLTIWACCQHMIRELEQGGEQAAAMLLRKIGPTRADAAKDLAYCLYDICINKRRDAGEAASYNGLIAVWSELTRQAATIQDTPNTPQESIFVET